MIVKMFKPKFSPLVEQGAKKQTMRPTPKRPPPKVGTVISLREWTGKPYRSKQRVLLESVITKVEEVWFNGVTLLFGEEIKNTTALLPSATQEAFAQADGFSCLREMAQWFEETHGLPFKGIVIHWR